MKYIFIFLLTLSMASYSSAEESLSGPNEQLQKIVELLSGDSREDALSELKLHESDLVTSVHESEDAAAYMLLGRAYFYAEMDAKAIEIFSSALQLDPSLSEAHFFVGVMHSYANELDNAEESYRLAIAANSNDEKYFVALGRTLESKNDTTSASAAYNKALAINDDNFDANFSLATILATAGDVDGAEKHYLLAIEAKPDDLDSYYNLGQLYQNADLHKLAIKQFETVVDLNPSDWRALSKLVQENEAVSNYAARDLAIKAIYEIWRSNADKELNEQGFYIRDQSMLENGKLYVLEYFELKGEQARKLVFSLQDEQTDELKFKVSLGSYDHTTNYARANGSIGALERRYHLDGYGTDGSHYTYAFFNGQPTYEVAKEIALQALAGEYEIISSTTITDGSLVVTITPNESEK